MSWGGGRCEGEGNNCPECISILLDERFYHFEGGNWGSTYIDQAYADFLTSLFGEEIISNFKKNKPAEWCLPTKWNFKTHPTYSFVEVWQLRQIWNNQSTRDWGRRQADNTAKFFFCALSWRSLSVTRRNQSFLQAVYGAYQRQATVLEFFSWFLSPLRYVKYREGSLQVSVHFLLEQLFYPVIRRIESHVEYLIENELQGVISLIAFC